MAEERQKGFLGFFKFLKCQPPLGNSDWRQGIERNLGLEVLRRSSLKKEERVFGRREKGLGNLKRKCYLQLGLMTSFWRRGFVR